MISLLRIILMLGTAFLGYKFAKRWVEQYECDQIEFSPDAKIVIASARSEAARDGFTRVGSERFLLGAVLISDSPLPAVLMRYGLTFTAMHKEIRSIVGTNDPILNTDQTLSPRATMILDKAKKLAAKSGGDYARPEHLLIALIEDGEGVGARVLDNLKVDRRALLRDLNSLDNHTKSIGP